MCEKIARSFSLSTFGIDHQGGVKFNFLGKLDRLPVIFGWYLTNGWWWFGIENDASDLGGVHFQISHVIIDCWPKFRRFSQDMIAAVAQNTARVPLFGDCCTIYGEEGVLVRYGISQENSSFFPQLRTDKGMQNLLIVPTDKSMHNKWANKSFISCPLTPLAIRINSWLMWISHSG